MRLMLDVMISRALRSPHALAGCTFAASPTARPHPRPRRWVAMAAGDDPGVRQLTIIHFNDVYDISARAIEPVGGAARFAHLVRQYDGDRPLTLFSGDCLNPSLLSAFTRGEQMVPILNGIGVNCACVGNHGETG